MDQTEGASDRDSGLPDGLPDTPEFALGDAQGDAQGGASGASLVVVVMDNRERAVTAALRLTYAGEVEVRPLDVSQLMACYKWK